MATDYASICQENIEGYGKNTHHLDLLGRLYADPAHFVFELLQNAEDAGAEKVRFSLFPDRLEFLNDGRPFNEADVRGICAIGKGTKADDLTQIGRFGIGFKSVYAHTFEPQVHSGTEHFRIQYYVRPYAGKEQLVAAPWTTLFVLPFKEPDNSHKQIAAKLQRLDTRSLLFLRNLREIEWSVENGERGLFIRETEPCRRGRLIRIVGKNGPQETDEQWLIFARYLPLEWYADNKPVPEDRRLRVEIAFALERSAANSAGVIKRAASSALVVFFPTEKATNFGFLIQGPYRTTPTRENVPADDEWNRKLISETAELVAELLPQLRDMDLLTVGALQTLPIRADDFPEGGMFRPIFERVRVALSDQELLPAHDQSFISANAAKLARGADLRELVTDDQLSELYGKPFKWLSEQITQDRTPVLRAYLIEHLNIDEVDAEVFAHKLDTTFLERRSDEWMIRFYKFLAGHRALWWPWSGPLRNKVFIRLEDGSHVLPFRDGGASNAYIPPSDGTDLPTVKRAIAADKEACEFLRTLGLTEPDPVAEVIERVLPKYGSNAPISAEEHRGDLQKILSVLRQAPPERREQLIRVLRYCAFLYARNCATSVTKLKKPNEIYFPTVELEGYFRNNVNAWLLSEPTIDEKNFELLRAIDVKSEPPSECQPNAVGYVSLGDYPRYHERGLNGFDRRCNIDGLKEAMQNISTELAQYIWSYLLPVHRRHIRGTIQRSNRKDYSDPWDKEECSQTGKILTEAVWLPDKCRTLHKPAEIGLSDLPETFTPDEEIARCLNMKPTLAPGLDRETLLRAAGLEPKRVRFVEQNPEIIDFLANRPESVERIRNEIESSTQDVNGDSTNFDYQAEFADVFSHQRLEASDEDGLDTSGQMPNPERRRQKLQEEIRSARGQEPDLTERFRRVPRKIWESKNSAIRTFFEAEYHGRCQICDFTFPERSGRSYFEGTYLVSRTHARWIGRPGNVLCLCANCCAKFVHGEVVADDVLQQIERFKPSKEGGPSIPSLRVVLCGEQIEIRFSERHLMDLQELLRASMAQANSQLESEPDTAARY